MRYSRVFAGFPFNVMPYFEKEMFDHLTMWKQMIDVELYS